jgi:hypothetical protein
MKSLKRFSLLPKSSTVLVSFKPIFDGLATLNKLEILYLRVPFVQESDFAFSLSSVFPRLSKLKEVWISNIVNSESLKELMVAMISQKDSGILKLGRFTINLCQIFQQRIKMIFKPRRSLLPSHRQILYHLPVITNLYNKK